MFKTDILFTGFYGHKNTGDDAFVEVASWGAKRVWKKNNVRFLAKNNNLPHTVTPSKAFPFRIPKTFSLQLDLLLKNTDFLISAGGSTIHSKMKESNPKVKALKLKEKKGKIQIGGIGVSVGPFKSIEDEKSVEKYLKSIDFLSVRDQASYDYVSRLHLPYKPVNSFDLAALLPDIYQFHGKDNVKTTKTIGISVCPFESLDITLPNQKEEIRNKKMVDLIKKLDQIDNICFRFYVINGNNKIGDYNLTKWTIEQAAPKKYELINYSADTCSIWKSIAECDFVISTRLHAAIFACFAGTPFMLNEYHRKCSDFLENVGYQDRCRLYNNEYDVVEKASQIIEIINNPDSERFVASRVNEMRELARLNFTAINL